MKHHLIALLLSLSTVWSARPVQAQTQSSNSADSFEALFNSISTTFNAREMLGEATALSLIMICTWLFSQIVTWLLRRLQQTSRTRRAMLSRWIPIIRMLIWALGLSLAVVVLFLASASAILIFLGPVALGIGLASQDLLRNLLAGVILSLDREFQEGDIIRVGKHEGEVVAIGLRNIKLMTFDGHVVEVPNACFIAETSSNITSETTDAQVKIVMVLPAGVMLEQARQVAYTAAVVSRYGSLRIPAEVFIDTDGSEDLMTRLTIRGHVFDPTFEEHYRSDVISLVRRGLGLAGVSITPLTTSSIETSPLQRPRDNAPFFKSSEIPIRRD